MELTLNGRKMKKAPFPTLPALLVALVALFALAGPSSARTQAARSNAGALAPMAALGSCTWDRPGINPFMGDVVGAVDRYIDIAPDIRERIKARMVRRDYDDVVSIKRESITGRARYGNTIRDMHFGDRQLCHSVSRSAWSPQMQERGLVYCDSGQCILVPTVCRNVSRISRAEVSPDHAEGDSPEPVLVAAAPVVPPFGLANGGAPQSFEALAAPAAAVGGEQAPGGLSVGSDTFAPVVGLAPPGGSLFVPPSVATPGSGTPPAGVLPVTPIPEPETWFLMLGGLAALIARRGRRQGS